MLAGAIISMAIGIIILITCGAMGSSGSDGAVVAFFVGLLFVFVSVGLFQPSFNKIEDERLLKVMVSDKKATIKLNDQTQNFDYVLLDSTNIRVFTELNNNVKDK